MWVARDKNGRLNMFFYRPTRNLTQNTWEERKSQYQAPLYYYDSWSEKTEVWGFGSLKWEDEPVEVKLVSSGLGVIEMPSEEEIEKAADEISDKESEHPCDLSRTQTYMELGWSNLYNCCIEMAKWFKSKIIK